jgi:hypothetical protein
MAYLIGVFAVSGLISYEIETKLPPVLKQK